MIRKGIFAAILLLAAVVQAQFASPSQGLSVSLLESSAGFLAIPQVKKELGISEATGKKIDTKMNWAIQSHLAKMRKAGSKMSSEDRLKAMRELESKSKVARKECLAMLTANQKNRLKQIGIQQMGPGALVHPEVKKALGLSPEQSSKVSEIVSQGTRALFERMQGKEQPKSASDAQKTFAEFAKAREAAHKQMLAASLKVLTASQRTKFTAMQGKPFKLNLTSLARRA